MNFYDKQNSWVNSNFQNVLFDPDLNCQLNENLTDLFSHKTIDNLSSDISKMIYNIIGQKVIIPYDKIAFVLKQLYDNSSRNNIGCIYSKDIQPKVYRNDKDDLLTQCLSFIVQEVTNTLQIDQNNNKLNIWDATILGDMNPLGLRQFPPIKLKERRPDPMLFHMRY